MTTMTTQSKPVLIDPEKTAHKQLSKPSHFVMELELTDHADRQNVFIVVPARTLYKYDQLVENAITRIKARLRVLLIQYDEDTDYQSILDVLLRRPWNKLWAKIFMFQDWKDANRVLHAWCNGSEKDTIANATVEGDKLIVRDCTMTKYEIEFNQLQSLKTIPLNHRHRFQIDEFGDALYWTDEDHHVQILDAIRYRQDPDYKAIKDASILVRNKEYGWAIAQVRQKHNLKQTQIPGLTERHIRRIEKSGQHPTLNTLRKLAKAHGLEFDEYLDEIARVLQGAKQKL